MSTDTTEMDESTMGTKPEGEHAWLQKLVGEWRTETEMTMGPGGETMKSTGSEKVVDMGGLWAFGEGRSQMPNGDGMDYKVALGFDVSFKEYRGCWFASMSSHMWKYVGTLSADGKSMTVVTTTQMGERKRVYDKQ